MTKRLVTMSIAILLCSCTSKPANKDISFSGTWIFTGENINSGNPAGQTSYDVIADGRRFRVMQPASDPNAVVTVYDGERMFTTNRLEAADARSPAGATVSPNWAERQRFWIEKPEGISSSGGQIAGHNTILYERSSRTPDALYGGLSVQQWIDPETGIVLKKIEISGPEGSVVRKTWECQKIEFGPVNAAAFTSPLGAK